jgi:hypothetical protein
LLWRKASTSSAADSKGNMTIVAERLTDTDADGIIKDRGRTPAIYLDKKYTGAGPSLENRYSSKTRGWAETDWGLKVTDSQRCFENYKDEMIGQMNVIRRE